MPCFLDNVGYKGAMTGGDEKVSSGLYSCLRERLTFAKMTVVSPVETVDAGSLHSRIFIWLKLAR